MQRKWFWLLLIPILLVLAGCSEGSFDVANLPIIGRTDTPTPSVTPTPYPTSTNTPTSTPTSTSTPTNTPTPTNTTTPTLTPTPYGGGNGEVIIYDRFSVYRVRLNDSPKEIIFPAQIIFDELSIDKDSGDFLNIGYISPDGRKFLIVTCKDQGSCQDDMLYVFLVDISQMNVKRILIPGMIRPDQVLWHSDSKKIIVPIYHGDIIREYNIYIIDTGDDSFGEMVRFGNATSAFWSSDNYDVFYFRHPDLYRSDIKKTMKIACPSCDMGSSVSYAGGSSMKGNKIAMNFTNDKLTIMNDDFSNPVTYDVSNFGHVLQWSPDGKEIALLTNSPYRIMLLDTISEDLQTFTAKRFPILLCNWSPDSKLISYISISDDRQTALNIINVETQEKISLPSSSCPVWITSP